MKRPLRLPDLSAILLLLLVNFVQAQRPTPPTSRVLPQKSPYEYTVNLSARQILQPGILSGPLFSVREQVVTDFGINTFAIDTKHYGTFLAHTNSQLVERIAEIVAMKRIDDAKRSEAYGRAVDRASDRESDAADDAVADIVSPIEEEPFTGIGKFFKRIGVDRENENDIDADDVREYKVFQSKRAIANAQAKRGLCRYLGLNPYTTNQMLQRKLDDMSNAITLGGFKINMIPGVEDLDSGLASEIWRAQVSPQMAAMVYGKDQKELRASLGAALEQMGLPPDTARAFLSNPYFTRWQQAQFVTALQALSSVTGRELLVREAGRAVTEQTDATFYTGTVHLIARLATQGRSIARIEMQSSLPYCILRDGSVLLALYWDYARWSPTAEKCATWFQKLQADGKKPPSVTLAISGQASAKLHEEMGRHGIKVLDLQDRGPL